MTRRIILFIPLILLLRMSLRAEKPEFNWKAVHERVTDLLHYSFVDEAQSLLEASVRTAHARNDTSEGLAAALNDLGSLYHDSGRYVDAERAYRESLSLWRRIDKTNPKFGIALGNFAGLRLVQGKPSDAEKLYHDAEQVLVSTLGPDSPELSNILSGLAGVYLDMGAYQAARTLAERAVSILDRETNNSQVGVAAFVLAKTAWKQNSEDEAEQLLRRALEVWQRTLGYHHPTTISGIVSLAMVISNRNPNEANHLFSNALQSLQAELDPEHVLTGYTLMAYAQYLENHGRKTDAKSLKRRGEKILVNHSRDNFLGLTLDIKAFQRSNAR